MSVPGKKSGSKRKSKSDFGVALVFLAPNLIGFLIFTMVPMIFSLVMSLYDWPLTGERAFVGAANFVKLFTEDVLFWKIMKNTLVYVAAYVAFNVLIAMGMAVWITSLKKANEFFRSAFFLPMMIGIVSSTMIFKWILSDGGLVNSVIRFFGGEAPNWFGSTATAMIAVVIVSVWQGFGYNMVIFISGLLGVSQSVQEAAKIDGANAVQTFFRVTLPCMSPSIFFAVVMTVISSFQVFDQTFVSTMGGPNNETNTLVLYLYNNAFKYQRLGYASAIAWVLFFCVLIVTAFLMKQQKRFVNYES
ncbi:MAG: sugar ABC transporter permease [Ruminococcus sp.]|nr:sugar ABC transporter permease [Ruminococcus sp.]